MSETLTIKNFGPIRDITLDLKKVNILIGDQGTGKSTVAKILVSIQNTFFKEIPNLEGKESLNRDTKVFFEYLHIVEIFNFIKQDTRIKYDHAVFNFEFSDSIVTIEKKIDLNAAESSRYDLYYIPAERSSVNLLSNSLYALLETGTALPRLFLRFGDRYLKARKEKETIVLDYGKILGVKLVNNDGRDYLELNSGKLILFSESSSGVQSSLTLLAVYDSITEHFSSYASVVLTRKFLVPIIIEEPEISCFPATQSKIINHLISKLVLRAVDLAEYSNQLLITTHSPYILTSLNNLMYAYEVGQKEPEETTKIIEKKYWMNPDDVSAYLLLADGTCEDILDREENLIKAEKIDEVSGFLNEQFDALLNIELVQK